MTFWKYVDTGDVSQDWRTANITPLFKKGKSSQAENCRPVSLKRSRHAWMIKCLLIQFILTWPLKAFDKVQYKRQVLKLKAHDVTFS